MSTRCVFGEHLWEVKFLGGVDKSSVFLIFVCFSEGQVVEFPLVSVGAFQPLLWPKGKE